MQIAFTAHLPFRRARVADATEHRDREHGKRTRAARRGAACDDKAFYACSCGYAFMANVSTTVGCPHCGADQGW